MHLCGAFFRFLLCPCIKQFFIDHVDFVHIFPYGAPQSLEFPYGDVLFNFAVFVLSLFSIRQRKWARCHTNVPVHTNIMKSFPLVFFFTTCTVKAHHNLIIKEGPSPYSLNKTKLNLLMKKSWGNQSGTHPEFSDVSRKGHGSESESVDDINQWSMYDLIAFEGWG